MSVERGAAFPDRLAASVEARRSQVVLGLDPDPAALWPGAVEALPASGTPGAGGPAAPRLADTDQRSAPEQSVDERAVLTAAAVVRHCLRAIDAAGPACVALKAQAACFERLGGPGWSALAEVVRAARAAGLLAIVDAKRGDVPVTARAYAQALVGETPGPFGPLPGLGADAFTANPLLGRDSLAPFAEAAEIASAGCFVLVRTSNPGAAELQDAPVESPLHDRLALLVDELGAGLRGDCGLSAIGAVVGATRPDLLERMRTLMPAAIFLLPGVGAQGGAAAALGPAFAPHPAGGLVSASRSIVDAHHSRGGEPAAAAAAAAEELRAAAWKAAIRGPR